MTDSIFEEDEPDDSLIQYIAQLQPYLCELASITTYRAYDMIRVAHVKDTVVMCVACPRYDYKGLPLCVWSLDWPTELQLHKKNELGWIRLYMEESKSAVYRYWSRWKTTPGVMCSYFYFDLQGDTHAALH